MSPQEVAVIDLSQRDEAALAHQLVEAFSTLGFATVVHHGIPLSTVENTFGASKSFFDLPLHIKQKYKYRGHDSNRGFIQMGKETHERGSTGGADFKETYDIGKEGELGLETPWPLELEDFREDLLEYYGSFDKLHLRLLRLLAIGLKLDDPGFFVDRCNAQHCNLRLLHYPELKRKKGADSNLLLERGALHTDFGTLTLLTQDQTGGLRVQRRDGTWTFLKPLAGGIVINVGDMLQRWTNDVLRATPHQVVEHPDHSDVIPERYSIAFFCNANKEVMLEPLVSVSQEAPKYPVVNAHDYLTRRLSDTIQNS